jgi:NAD(P)-dependent dehydrogenase (short-subunit alcohol dehydrogenase family)
MMCDRKMHTTALVTGASQGIGAAIAHRLAAEAGMKLALVARNLEKLHCVADHCRSLGAEVRVYSCDLTVEREVQDMADAVRRDLDTPDLLINNAGQFVRADLLGMDQAGFQSVLDTNLTSAFLVTRHFIAGMQAKKRGTIFFMGSVASKQAFPESGAYCVAKHGLLGLSRAFRASAAGSGLRISAILPGATESPSWTSDELASEGLMPAEDMAQAVLDIYKLSERTVVEEILLRPLRGDL